MPVASSLTKNNQESIVFTVAAATPYWLRVFPDFRSPGQSDYALWLQPGGGGCPPICADLIIDGDESDVDCGGSCTPCISGLRCASATDCGSGICTNGLCQ